MTSTGFTRKNRSLHCSRLEPPKAGAQFLENPSHFACDYLHSLTIFTFFFFLLVLIMYTVAAHGWRPLRQSRLISVLICYFPFLPGKFYMLSTTLHYNLFLSRKHRPRHSSSLATRGRFAGLSSSSLPSLSAPVVSGVSGDRPEGGGKHQPTNKRTTTYALARARSYPHREAPERPTRHPQ